MLTDEERVAACDSVADFAIRLLNAATVDEKAMHEELDSFFEFFCNALAAAKRDARYNALITTLN